MGRLQGRGYTLDMSPQEVVRRHEAIVGHAPAWIVCPQGKLPQLSKSEKDWLAAKRVFVGEHGDAKLIWVAGDGPVPA